MTFKTILLGLFAVLLTAFVGSSNQVQAAGNGCSVFGMLDPRVRALCENVTQNSRGSDDQNQYGAPANNPNGRDVSGGYRQDDNYASAPPAAPAPGVHRYDIAKGGLYIDLADNYPQGYGPSWTLNGTVPQQIVTDRYNRLNRGPQGTESLFIQIGDDQGRAVLAFARRGTPTCLADIVGLPQVITEAPKRFGLTNFRYANNQGPQCQRRLGSMSPWQGTLTLSAAPNGDMRVSLVLDLAQENGTPWFEFTARDLPFANQMTAEMASAKVAQAKAVEAQRQAEIARLAALPKAGPVWTKKLEATVEKDSMGWAFNHFDRGSVHNVRIYDGSAKSGNMTLRGEYTYNSGMPGWVLAQISAGKLDCVKFWDAVIGCRGLRTPEDGAAMRNAAVQAVKDSFTESNSGGGRGSCTGVCEDHELYRQQQENAAYGR